MDVLLFLAALFSGICASMGLGGGSILILYLTFFMGIDRIVAGGVNLLFFIPVAMVSVFMSVKAKSYKIKEVIPYALSGMIFSALGIYLAIYLKSKTVSFVFGIALLIMGIYEGVSVIRNKRET